MHIPPYPGENISARNTSTAWKILIAFVCFSLEKLLLYCLIISPNKRAKWIEFCNDTRKIALNGTRELQVTDNSHLAMQFSTLTLSLLSKKTNKSSKRFEFWTKISGKFATVKRYSLKIPYGETWLWSILHRLHFITLNNIVIIFLTILTGFFSSSYI